MREVALWLTNKLGIQGDSWGSGGSICSQLNKEVLRNIKDCFPDLQTQVKLKLLLSFFHIPRRMIDEWRTELEEILEVAAVDSELWVSMLSETMKTYPATGSLNTEITDYDETRPIFTDMVSDLKKLVSKTNDLGMLPLECEYLNKTALAAVVGHQPVHEKHFTLKRKPKSNSLRAELLQKSVDAQSSLKKTSAPTVPLRSRGIPRKMTDTTPLKGIPSRVPTSGFRSPPSSTSTTRPSMSRTTPAGRKDGGIKLLEIEDQPLGYAATKKRKRQQEIEEQAKKTVETGGAAGAVSENNTNTANDSSAASTPTTPTITTPDYAAGLTASIVYSQPPTPMPPAQAEIPAISTATSVSSIPASAASESPPAVVQIVKVKEPKTPKRQKLDNAEIKSTEMKSPDSKNVILVKKEVKQEPKLVKVARNQLPTLITAQSPVKSMPTTTSMAPSFVTIKAVSAPMNPGTTTTIANLSNLGIPSNTKIVRHLAYVTQAPPTSSTVTITKGQTIITGPGIKNQPLTKTIMTQPQSKPTILSNIILTPKQGGQAQQQYTVINSGGQQQLVQRVMVSGQQTVNIPSLTSTVARSGQPTIIQPVTSQNQGAGKIMQIKTAPTILSVAQQQNAMQNIPPLIATQQPQLLNFQNVQGQQRKTVTITAQPNQLPTGNVQRITLSQAQAQVAQQQQQQNLQQQGTPQKLTQLMMPSGMNVKGKTIILTNPNLLNQKNVILQSIGPGGNPIYQQIPISNMSNIAGLRGATIVTGPPGLVKAGEQQKNNQMPALVPTSNLSGNIQGIQGLRQVVVQTSNSQTMPTLTTNNVHIRPMLGNMPQGQLTLIQRPGQQPQLVQTIQQSPQQTIQRAIITQQPQQTIQIQQQPQIVQTSQAGTTAAIQTQRRGLSLSNKHVMEAHEMFKRANRVTRLDKALILGFMAGYRDNPRPNPENVVTIKLNESREHVKQEDGQIIMMTVDTLIRLDYKSGEWKTFRTCRKLDPNTQANNETAALPTATSNTQNPQNSVVI